MDTKNIIAAISLSAAVIILYGLFFAHLPPDPKQIQTEKNITNETSDAPSLDQNEQISKISRDEAIEEGDRILSATSNKHILISDLYINNKLSTLGKLMHPIIVNKADRIIWVPGMAHAEEKEKPTKQYPTVVDKKILFFYDFPELVEMRDFIRSNL